MRSGNSLYTQIYQYVKEAILSGQYPVGQMIPTEQELMDQFAVSRITTNRALQMLTSEGLIKRRAGLGTFVCDVPLAEPSESTAQRVTSSTTPSTTAADDAGFVGFVIPFMDGTFGPVILRCVERILAERGYSVVLGSTYGDQQKEQEVIRRLVRGGVKGLIVLPVNGEYYSDEILRLHVERFPIVLVDKSLPGIPLSYVASDNYAAAKSLTNHLISRGHQDIGFLSLSLNGTSTLVDRYNGYTDSLAANGIVCNPDYHLTAPTAGTIVDGLDTTLVATITQFLSDSPQVTAMFAVDDNLAEHALAAALSLGKSIPEQFALTCFDGPSEKTLFWHFTRAVQNEEEMARQCIRILDQLWADERSDPPQSVIIPCDIRIGPSTVPGHTLGIPRQLTTSR